MPSLSKRAPVAERLAARSERRGDCLIYVTGWANSRGHVRIGYLGRLQYVHRVAYMLANGELPDDLDVLHSCDTPRCIEPAHLRLGTDLDNARDRASRGRSARLKGTKNGNAILTEAKAEQILLALRGGESLVPLGDRFGVCFQTVWRIGQGRSWAHVRPDIARPVGRSRTGARAA